MEAPLPNPNTPVTDEHVKEAQQQTESTYRQLMDQMKASVPENGQFFREIGHKPTEPNNPDGRVLILINALPLSPSEVANAKTKHVAITEKGLMAVTLGEQDYETLRRTNIEEGASFIYDERTGGGRVLFADTKLFLPPFKRFGTNENEMNWGRQAMQDSIEKARKTGEQARNRKALEEAQQRQTIAKGLSELFNQTIKPPSAEGTAAPPTSTPTV